MTTTAVVFPGQGAQKAGMGRDFAEAFAESRTVFEEASDALGTDLAALCFEDDPTLTETTWQQPAILTVEIAMWRALTAHFGVTADVFGGHSLGEYAALTAAGVLGLADAVRLVHRRGRLMQEAVPHGEGAMVAIIAREIPILEVEACLNAHPVDIANHNAAGQVVLSGASTAMAPAIADLKGLTALEKARFIPLRVSAPFHSRLMSPVVEPFGMALTEHADAFAPAKAAAVTSNFTGTFHSDRTADLRQALLDQICGRVRWVENMDTLGAKSSQVLEIGPGKPLAAFFRSRGQSVRSVTSLATAEGLLSQED